MITQKDLHTFRAYCQKWLKKLSIDDWNIEYSLDTDDDMGYAKVTGRDLEGRVGKMVLCAGWKQKPTSKELDNVAKHEVIHILLSDLSILAGRRCVTEDELYRAEEALTVKLEKLL